jgi:homoserine kinase type II
LAVYTDVGDEALEAFLEAYDLGTLRSFKGIAEGVENSNFLLGTERGHFILTLYEKRVAEADLPFFLALLDHLTERGLSCPRPVHGRDGAAVRRLAGRPAAIFTFLDGVSVRRPTVAQCGAAGEALARLHLAGDGFAATRANALSVEGWRALIERIGARADDAGRGLGALIAASFADVSAAWPTGLPNGTIHADMFPDNVFFIGERLSGIIDFYFACTDALAYDVAICLNAWCFETDGSFNITKGRALLAGYRAVRDLSTGEAQALPALAQGAALRFLLTRTHDWLNRDPGALVRPKDPMEYAAKLRFHRTVRAPEDYGL